MSERVMARLSDGMVMEVRTATPEKPFHPDLAWDEFPPMAVPSNTRWLDITAVEPRPGVKWAFDGESFTAPAPKKEPTLEEVKKGIRRLLADQVNSFIDTKTDIEGGGNRYDSGFKITAVNLKIEYRAALAAGGLTVEQEAGIEARLARIGELETWINAVMAEYQAKVASVLAATTIEEARAVTLDLDRFVIGATGEGAHPDPDVYLSEIA